MKMNTVANPAVVFDVDSTLLEKQNGRFRRIESIHDVLVFCQENAIQCHIVTARLDFHEGRSELRRVLRELKLSPSKFSSMHMRPDHIGIRPKYLSTFKKECRDKICNDHNVTIIANIGDNWHDLVGSLHSLKSLDDKKSYIAFFPHKIEASVKLPTDLG
jgi:hypothetical protein